VNKKKRKENTYLLRFKMIIEIPSKEIQIAGKLVGNNPELFPPWELDVEEV
jgi:hypothetical protein